MKKRKKVGDMEFLAKTVAIYSGKKTEFNSIKNNRDNELAYFWLTNS